MEIEEKAKAYEEMVQRVKELHEAGNDLTKKQMEIICPELAESEDERVRKDIIALIKFALEDGSAVSPGSHTTKEEALAYLEKQKELDKMIVVSPEVWDNAISDAFENGKKEGEKQKEQKTASISCGHENDTEWSEEDEEMRKSCLWVIEHQKSYTGVDNEKAWLKSIPERFNLQPKAEWSEEDDQLIGFIFDLLNSLVWRKEWAMDKKECLERLKSFRPQPHWKPSDEQIRPLEYAIEYFKKKKNDVTYLESLYHDLEKLI